MNDNFVVVLQEVVEHGLGEVCVLVALYQGMEYIQHLLDGCVWVLKHLLVLVKFEIKGSKADEFKLNPGR